MSTKVKVIDNSPQTLFIELNYMDFFKVKDKLYCKITDSCNLNNALEYNVKTDRFNEFAIFEPNQQVTRAKNVTIQVEF